MIDQDYLSNIVRSIRNRRFDYKQHFLSDCDVQFLAEAKDHFVRIGDDENANFIWFLECFNKVHVGWSSFYKMCGDLEFYKGWCKLEEIENTLLRTRQHFQREFYDFHGWYFLTYVRRWQSLYPYTMFFSPGFVVLSSSCGLCGKKLTPKSRCEHKKNELYGGRMAYHGVCPSDFYKGPKRLRSKLKEGRAVG